jgi:hypothetical protein
MTENELPLKGNLNLEDHAIAGRVEGTAYFALADGADFPREI